MPMRTVPDTAKLLALETLKSSPAVPPAPRRAVSLRREAEETASPVQRAPCAAFAGAPTPVNSHACCGSLWNFQTRFGPAMTLR